MQEGTQPPGGGLRCPRCHQPMMPGQNFCAHCGYHTGDYIVVQPFPRTWQENLYLVWSFLLILQGLLVCVYGAGVFNHNPVWPLFYLGFIIAAVAVGLLLDQLWAQWTARAAGIPAILGSAGNALRMGLSIGTWPHAKEECLVSVGLLVYWCILEYLIAVVGE